MTAEQLARDLLEKCGVDDAQLFTAGDIVPLANFVALAELHAKQLIEIRAVIVAGEYPCEECCKAFEIIKMGRE